MYVLLLVNGFGVEIKRFVEVLRAISQQHVYIFRSDKFLTVRKSTHQTRQLRNIRNGFVVNTRSHALNKSLNQV